MKIRQISIPLIACLICSVLSVGFFAYGVITITSNPVEFSSTDAGNLLLALNSTNPHVSETVKLTATMSIPQTGATVTFYLNGTQLIGTVLTDGSGIAVLNFPIASVYTHTIATAKFTAT